MIATSYTLPFRFLHSDEDTLFGRPVLIRVRTVRPDVTRLVSVALRRFTRMASSGAFGSKHCAPWDTEFAALAQTSLDPREVLVRANPCRLAPEAWIVLCHLLLTVHSTLPIESVEVIVIGDSSPITLRQGTESTYPPSFEPLPFVLEDTEPEGGGYSFYIKLASPLTQKNEVTLNDQLDAWVQVIAHGGYGLAPVDPATDYVEPYGDGVEAYDDIVEWAIFKLRADPVAAIDALLNMLACFHAHCQTIRSVEIG